MRCRSRWVRGIFLMIMLAGTLSCKLSLPGHSNVNQSPSSAENNDSSDQSISGPGQTRNDPIPKGTLVSLPGWDVQVVEFLRGEDALKIINTADWQARTAPDGQEYVLAKVFLRCTSLDENYHDLGISQMYITGDRSIGYGDKLDGWPAPEFLFEDMYTAETVEGWVDAVVPIDENNMELVVNLSDPQPLIRFFALEKDASVSMPKELIGLGANDIGATTSTPAKVGQQIITPGWAVTVVNSIRGADANLLLSTNNEYYEAPPAGVEYVVIQVDLSFKNPKETSVWIGSNIFYGQDASGNQMDSPNVYTMSLTDMTWINQIVLPGAKINGWVLLSIPDGASPAIIVFDPNSAGTYSNDPDIRYISIP